MRIYLLDRLPKCWLVVKNNPEQHRLLRHDLLFPGRQAFTFLYSSNSYLQNSIAVSQGVHRGNDNSPIVCTKDNSQRQTAHSVSISSYCSLSPKVITVSCFIRSLSKFENYFAVYTIPPFIRKLLLGSYKSLRCIHQCCLEISAVLKPVALRVFDWYQKSM